MSRKSNLIWLNNHKFDQEVKIVKDKSVYYISESWEPVNLLRGKPYLKCRNFQSESNSICSREDATISGLCKETKYWPQMSNCRTGSCTTQLAVPLWMWRTICQTCIYRHHFTKLIPVSSSRRDPISLRLPHVSRTRKRLWDVWLQNASVLLASPGWWGLYDCEVSPTHLTWMGFKQKRKMQCFTFFEPMKSVPIQI